MLQTKYVIKPTRPDLDYFYCGRTREENSPLFDYRKQRAKRYAKEDDATADLEILNGIKYNETLTVEAVRCRT